MENDFEGTWRDDKGRLIVMRTIDQKKYKFFGSTADKEYASLYDENGVALDGSKLMTRKRGDEQI